MQILRYPIIGVIFLFYHIGTAQISQGGLPPSFKNPGLKTNAIPTIKTAIVDYQKMLAEDISSTLKDEPLRFAYAHYLNISPTNSGIWSEDSEGNRYWKLSLVSEGAKSLNLSFSDFYLPEGAQLFLYNKERTDIKGAFTSINNKKSRKFGTAPVKGDHLIIEYYEPKKTKEAFALEIETVAHDYRNVYALAKSFDSSGSCNINVNCAEGEEWQDQKRSVALITLENGTRWCTGSLVNNENNDGTPYFLTANHCLTEDVERWVFYFNYESVSCETQDGTFTQSISGSEVLANGSSSDYLLLELSAKPPADYNVFYAGWDATDKIPEQTVAIHHPSGDVKKISFDNDAPTIVNYTSPETESHWEVGDWDIGTTEKGSSGSPLFDENKRIIGHLHGGVAACGINEPDYYGRFTMSFQNISSFLSGASQSSVLDGYDPNKNADCITTNLNLTLDNFPEETSWELKNDNNEIIHNGSDYSEVADGTALIESFCLAPGCYTFTIYDSAGDGMCCGYGDGSYTISDNQGMLTTGASFAESVSATFCVGAGRTPAPINRSVVEPSVARPLSQIKVYPNPVEDVLFIDYKVKQGSSVFISVYTITGSVVHKFTMTGTESFDRNQLSVSQLPPGTYFLKAVENSNAIVKKFVVTK